TATMYVDGSPVNGGTFSTSQLVTESGSAAEDSGVAAGVDPEAGVATSVASGVEARSVVAPVVPSPSISSEPVASVPRSVSGVALPAPSGVATSSISGGVRTASGSGVAKGGVPASVAAGTVGVADSGTVSSTSDAVGDSAAMTGGVPVASSAS